MPTVRTLPSGLRVVLEARPDARSAALGFWIGAGSRHETAERHGVAHLTEHLLFKGSRNRPTSLEITRDVERLGGELNGETDNEHTGYFVKVPSEHWRTALDVLAEMIRFPRLRARDVRNERRVVSEEIAGYRDTASEHVLDRLEELLWPEQALGRPVLGTEASLAALGRKAVAEHLARFYTPANLVVSAAGRFDTEALFERLEASFSGSAGGAAPAFEPAREEQSRPAAVQERRDLDETQLCLAVRTFRRDHPDRYGLRLLQMILGEGMSSRLFQQIRDRRGLAYDVGTLLLSFSDAGALVVHAGAAPRRAEEAAKRILEELLRLAGEPPSDRELADAKEQYLGGLALDLEDTGAYSDWSGKHLLLNGAVPDLEEVERKVRAVERQDLLRIARACFREERLSLAVVGVPLRRLPFEA
ncbi:MAG: insulinase family protein [Deltaproteobacteria bacterium]|nr:insulinase family protein [Deltaproteobacteria bacterium]